MAEISGASSVSTPSSSGSSGVSSRPDTEAAPSGGTDTAPESTIERGEEAQSADAPSGTPSEALSGDDGGSDPDNSVEMTGFQSDVAESVTGAPEETEEEASPVSGVEVAGVPGSETDLAAAEEAALEEVSELTEEQQTRLDSYNEARALVDAALASSDITAGFQPEVMAAKELIEGFSAEYDTALTALGEAFEVVDKEVAYQSTIMGNEGQLLEGDELERLQEFTDARVEEDMIAFETATEQMVELVDDPAFQAYLEDMDPYDQQQFFEDMAQYMPLSETGREWTSGLTDGLAELDTEGTTGEPIAELAASLREAVPETKLDDLDRALGTLVGSDRNLLGPEGQEKLEAVVDGLGLPQTARDTLANLDTATLEDLGPFLQSASISQYLLGQSAQLVEGPDGLSAVGGGIGQVGTGVGSMGQASSALARVARRSPSLARALGTSLDGLEALGRGASFLGKGLGRVSTVFSVGALAVHLSQGNVEGATDEAIGLAGGAAVAAGGVIGSGGLALAGYALIGASMVAPFVRESANYQAYVDDAVLAALGPEEFESPRGQSLRFADSNGADILNELRPEGVSLPEFFAQRVAGEFGPGALVTNEFWMRISQEYGAAELARLEAEAAARF